MRSLSLPSMHSASEVTSKHDAVAIGKFADTDDMNDPDRDAVASDVLTGLFHSIHLSGSVSR
jgi:hypothetical protein